MRSFSLILALLLSASIGFGQKDGRTIAVTIDDLPTVSTKNDPATRLAITKKLLRSLRRHKVPAVGFNENKLYAGEERDPSQIELLEMWLDAGLELGNHTYSHRSLNRIDPAEYRADVLRGQEVTSELLGRSGKRLRYFRHPFLQTGRTKEIKDEFAAFLKEHGYTIAPITHDNGDYIFARAYDIANDRGDAKLAKRVADAYVPYMEQKLDYWERQSVKLFGREISQTLLLHANSINAERFGELARMLKKRGYKFVDLETALKDPAYQEKDEYYGPAGISWLHRWAVARGRENVVPDEPLVPEFVLKLSGFESE